MKDSKTPARFAHAANPDRAVAKIEPASLEKNPLRESSSSELVYQRLVQSITDYAIFMLDVDGIVTTWNAGARLAKGYAAEDIVGRHFSCFYSVEERLADQPGRNLEVARQTGKYEAEGWRTRKDGSRFWAHVVIDALRDEQGHLFGFAKITRDCTEQKRLRDESLDHERRFRLLVEGVTDYAIYMLDPNGIVSNWNAGAQRAKGYTAAEIVGRHFSCFYDVSDRENGLPHLGLHTARTTGKFEAQGWRIRKNGSRFWAHVVIQPIYDDAGALFGFAKITRDCTEQRQIALALEETTRGEFNWSLQHLLKEVSNGTTTGLGFGTDRKTNNEIARQARCQSARDKAGVLELCRARHGERGCGAGVWRVTTFGAKMVS